MNNNALNASVFDNNITFYNKEFEDILAGIVSCYRSLLLTHIRLPPNDENEIRNIMLRDYLKNKRFKENNPPLNNYQFDKETSEENGRVDIRILSVNPYLGDYNYYIIECKRLDKKNQNGITGLNNKYIIDGIGRFVFEKYPFYDNVAGMIGFIITKMDIHKNTELINGLLKNHHEMKTKRYLTQKKIAPDFEYSYYSEHFMGDFDKVIYHLMLDFSENMSNFNENDFYSNN
jgi:hypothetical protein